MMADIGERKENKKGKNSRKESVKNLKGKKEVIPRSVPATVLMIDGVHDGRRGGGVQEGRTSLHIAVIAGSLREVELLLREGADVHCRSTLPSDKGRQPLHLAVRENHLRVASALLEAGSNPDAIDYQRSRPVHIAAKNAHVKMIGLLATFGARLECRDDEGLRALHIAAASGTLDSVRALYHYGCNLISEDAHQASALHHAARAGNLEVVRWLVEKQVPHDLPDVNGKRPCDWAEDSGHYEVQAYLMSLYWPRTTGNHTEPAVWLGRPKGMTRTPLFFPWSPLPRARVNKTSRHYEEGGMSSFQPTLRRNFPPYYSLNDLRWNPLLYAVTSADDDTSSDDTSVRSGGVERWWEGHSISSANSLSLVDLSSFSSSLPTSSSFSRILTTNPVTQRGMRGKKKRISIKTIDFLKGDSFLEASPPATPTKSSSAHGTSHPDNLVPESSSSNESHKTISQSAASQTPSVASQLKSKTESPTGSGLTLSPSSATYSSETPPVPADTSSSMPVAGSAPTLDVRSLEVNSPISKHSTFSSAYSNVFLTGSMSPTSPSLPQSDTKKHKTKKNKRSPWWLPFRTRSAHSPSQAYLVSVIRDLTLIYMEQNERIKELEEVEDQWNEMKKQWEEWAQTPEGRAGGIGENPFSDIPFTRPPMVSGVLNLRVEPSTIPDPEGPDIYSCVSNPRGVVIILNNKNFRANPQMTRHGSEYDVINLDNIFTQMGYQVSTHWDLPRDRTLAYFEEASRTPQLRNVSCLIVCILSHGKGNKSFLSHDLETVTLDEIRRCFLDKKCPYLQGKPKVFFTHFCRGSDDEMETPLVADAQLEAFKDMLCVYSTTEGFRAYRHGSLGTPFVRALCETLAKHAGKEELNNGLIKIFQREYKKLKGATTPEVQNFNFTKDFYFNPLPQRL